MTKNILLVELEKNPLSRRDREKRQRRREILNAAEKVFAERGYFTAPMEEVAREAEFSVGTLYNCFASKEQLYCELISSRSEQIMGRIMEALLTGASPLDRVRRCFQIRMAIYWEMPRFYRLFLHYTMHADFDPRPGLPPEVRRRYQAYLVDLEGVFALGMARKIFRDCAPRLLVVAFEGLIRNYTTTLARDGDAVRSQRDEESLFEIFCAGALADPSALGSLLSDADSAAAGTGGNSRKKPGRRRKKA